MSALDAFRPVWVSSEERRQLTGKIQKPTHQTEVSKMFRSISFQSDYI